MPPNYYLVYTSSGFTLPIMYGLYKGHTYLPIISCLSTSASIIYWMNPESIYKQNIEQILARTCGLIYFLHGYYYIERMPIRMLGYLNGMAILTCYYYSYYYHTKMSNSWVISHMLFHYFTILGQFLVLQ
jgi:hypothetical protein